MFNNFSSQKSYHLGKYVEEYCTAKRATDYNIICCVCLACWKRKATDTHFKYVILIAFPWQQWLLELASNIIYTLPVLPYRRRDVQAVCSKSKHAVTKSFRIRELWQLHMYSPFKKSVKSRQSFHHRHAQPSLTKVVMTANCLHLIGKRSPVTGPVWPRGFQEV
jgi:hypothetical protein